MMLKGEGKGPLPPLLLQYVDIVEQYPDYLVLFQVGDFYECFGDHAEKLARLLGLTLTRKTARDFITPMAGIPIRSADTYIERLLKLGLRVAVADQIEQAEDAEGLVRRDITQLITPGTITDEKLLPADANYLAAVTPGDGYGLAFLDVSTGEFRGTHVYSKASLYDELQRYGPAEVLLSPELFDNLSFREALNQRFPVMPSKVPFEQDFLVQHLQGLPLLDEALSRSAGAVLAYALETQRGILPQVTHFVYYDAGAYMHLDEIALSTLEIFDTPMKTGKTLFSILDETRTAPGRRLLKAYLRHPLLEQSLIDQRLDAVQVFVQDGVLRQDIRKTLYKMHDLERLATRLVTGRASARDLVALARSLALLPELVRLLSNQDERALQSLLTRLPDLQEVRSWIDAALVDEPPLKLTDGGLIKDGFDNDLDTLRQAVEQGRSWLAELELREREVTGIPTLKVGFSSVFGYYLEATRPYYEQVPKDYRPIQTLKDRQRYTRTDIREKEREILRAEDTSKRREYTVFESLRHQLAPKSQDIRDVAMALAELDVYTALAEVAAQKNYCRPTFSQDRSMHIQVGRHPVVEAFHRFIANDIALSNQERLIILTGPNIEWKINLFATGGLDCTAGSDRFFCSCRGSLFATF